MSRGFASNYRIVLLAVGLFVCFGGVGARLVWLHVLDRDNLLRNVAKTRQKTTRETARRGDILDSSGTVRLATSKPQVVVAVDPMMVRPDDWAKLPRLAELLNLPVEEVRRVFSTQYRTVTTPAPRAASPAAGAIAPVVPQPAAPANPLLRNLQNGSREAAAEVDAEFAQTMATANQRTVAPIDLGEPEAGDDAEEGSGETRRAIRWAKLRDDVSEATYAEIEKLGIKALCPPERRYARVYPHEQLAAHVVGFANRENRGATGIEAYADFYLRGQDGWREGEKDGRRRELAQFQTRELPRSDGYSVVLSIDATVQDIIEREVAGIVEKYQPLKATIIVSDPRTGFILGMANHPTYNPNEYNKLSREQMSRLLNIAVTDIYEPGSVFKIVAGAAALEEGLVSEKSMFSVSMTSFTYRGRDFKMPGEDHDFDRPISVAEIIAKSSNRGAAQLAMQLGDERFEKYIHAFGFGSKLGFPIGPEETGMLAPRQKWVPIDTSRIAMGHSIAATALQMHQAMSTIAAGGVLMRPQVVRQIRDASDDIVYQYAPAEIHRAVSRQTAQRMARMLQAVASPDGTAPGAAIKINGVDYEVAGKTGTAQKYIPQVMPSGKIKNVPSRHNHVVSFVGFFPASRPQVAISVIVDDADHRCPGRVAYGSSVAAPVFKSIGEKLIPILSITPPNQPARIDFVAGTQGGRR